MVMNEVWYNSGMTITSVMIKSTTMAIGGYNYCNHM